jgi:hypothetical protein
MNKWLIQVMYLTSLYSTTFALQWAQSSGSSQGLECPKISWGDNWRTMGLLSCRNRRWRRRTSFPGGESSRPTDTCTAHLCQVCSSYWWIRFFGPGVWVALTDRIRWLFRCGGARAIRRSESWWFRVRVTDLPNFKSKTSLLLCELYFSVFQNPSNTLW